MAENLKEILSPRQYEVIVGLAQGLDNIDIANSMGTTAGNISVLLTTICKRVGITSKEGISLREQLVNFVKENCQEENANEQTFTSESAGGGAMSEKMKTSASTSSTNEVIKRISESVDNVEIVQKIEGKLGDLYREVGKCYVNEQEDTNECRDVYERAKKYQAALEVVKEVMSCKE